MTGFLSLLIPLVPLEVLPEVQNLAAVYDLSTPELLRGVGKRDHHQQWLSPSKR
jgi:hypothetical protein